MQVYAQRMATSTAVVGLALVLAHPTQAQEFSTNLPGALVLQRILVKVNGGLVTQSTLEAAQISALRSRGAAPQTDEDLARLLQEITPEVLVNAVEELLLVQRARDLGYAFGDEQFQEILDGIKEENNMNDEQLIAALQSDEGMTLSELRDVMERQTLVRTVQQVEILRGVTITDTEGREYYDNHLDEFTDPATVTLREILIGAPDGGGALSGARDDQASTTAEAVRARVLAGEDFGAVASEVSGAASKTNGGLIGPIALADLAEAVRERVVGLEVGAVGEIERTTTGYHMLMLVSATQPEPRSFDDVRQGILDNIFDERRLLLLNDYLDTLREDAIIEWSDTGLKGLYDEALATRVALEALAAR